MTRSNTLNIAVNPKIISWSQRSALVRCADFLWSVVGRHRHNCHAADITGITGRVTLYTGIFSSLLV